MAERSELSLPVSVSFRAFIAAVRAASEQGDTTWIVDVISPLVTVGEEYVEKLNASIFDLHRVVGGEIRDHCYVQA